MLTPQLYLRLCSPQWHHLGRMHSLGFGSWGASARCLLYVHKVTKFFSIIISVHIVIKLLKWLQLGTYLYLLFVKLARYQMTWASPVPEIDIPSQTDIMKDIVNIKAYLWVMFPTLFHKDFQVEWAVCRYGRSLWVLQDWIRINLYNVYFLTPTMHQIKERLTVGALCGIQY